MNDELEKQFEMYLKNSLSALERFAFRSMVKNAENEKSIQYVELLLKLYQERKKESGFAPTTEQTAFQPKEKTL